jgi:hypothetical protein
LSSHQDVFFDECIKQIFCFSDNSRKVQNGTQNNASIKPENEQIEKASFLHDCDSFAVAKDNRNKTDVL